MCHHNSFLIYESLVDANAKRWNFVTHISVLFSMACSLVLGVTGYSTFTGDTQGNLALILITFSSQVDYRTNLSLIHI